MSDSGDRVGFMPARRAQCASGGGGKGAELVMSSGARSAIRGGRPAMGLVPEG